MAIADGDDGFEPLPVYEPNQSLAKTIGTLNIIFGAILLACGACGALNLVMQPIMGPMFQAQHQAAMSELQAQHERRIDRLRQEEKEATTPEEKAAIRTRRTAEEARPLPKVPDFTEFFRDTRFLAYGIVDTLGGIILNIGLLIAGIGLVRLRNWGRVMSLWVAALKIVCATCLLAILLVWAIPAMVEKFRQMIEEMAASSPPGMPPAAINQMMTFITYVWAAWAVIMYVVALIYPIVILVALTRRSVIAACTEPAVWEIEESH
jgi:hypothetical protein